MKKQIETNNFRRFPSANVHVYTRRRTNKLKITYVLGIFGLGFFLFEFSKTTFNHKTKAKELRATVFSSNISVIKVKKKCIPLI